MIQDKMDFSMHYINRFFKFFLMAIMISGCVSTTDNDWYNIYGTLETGKPAEMMYGDVYQYKETTDLSETHRMAVLLPLSGNAAKAGETIRSAIELGILQNAPKNLSVSFFDTAGDVATSINEALATNPEVIIGPLFSNDAKILRASKPENLPVLSFTSDAASLGQGVMTMALMPTNSVEAIVKEIISDGSRNLLILAPDTDSGKLMAGAARSAATYYDLPVSGLFFYKEKDTDSIKNTTYNASMYNARTAANTKAREILSDILTKETITAVEKSYLIAQLEDLSKQDTLGKVPYDAVLFLGNGDDTETLASFLRYYGVGKTDAKFYGTALWEGSDIIKDFNMSGAKYAVLPETAESFINIYELTTGQKPGHFASFGYDAANMAISMIYSNKSPASYLLDPSGYIGIDGLFRLKPSGVSERALNIVRLNGKGETEVVKQAPNSFLIPVYNIEQTKISPAKEMELESPGINPLTYIRIPERFTTKYYSRSYGANMSYPEATTEYESKIITIPEDKSESLILKDFQPVLLEQVNRTYLDGIEIEE